jgi:hypothetical protein
MRVFWSILLVELAACGFNPHPQNGALPCDKGCPSGYHCSIDGTCRTTEVGSGGVTASGGLTGSGGTPGIGGVVGTGGRVGSGGVTASGGLTGSGGIVGSGGLVGSGGTTGAGGVVGTGGIVGTGGTMGNGGTIVPGLAVFAGVPSGQGSADGTGAAALFSQPKGVAVDGSGNVFVADSGNNTIRKITSSGVVTTLAGTAGSSGSADGTGAAASFYFPKGVAVDGSGNVFVADSGNNAIRKITPSGVVTTIVGVAAPGGQGAGNSPGPLPASILSPSGVAIDPSTGKLYITLPDAVMVAVLPK